MSSQAVQYNATSFSNNLWFLYTQVLKLRRISFHLIVSWEYSSQTLTISNSLMVRNSNQILAKLRDHKVDINLLIKVKNGGRTMTIRGAALCAFITQILLVS
jgi:hypothetical protein